MEGHCREGQDSIIVVEEEEEEEEKIQNTCIYQFYITSLTLVSIITTQLPYIQLALQVISPKTFGWTLT